MKSEKELMMSSHLYIATGEEIAKMRKAKQEFLELFNNTKYSETEKRNDLVRKYFGSVGENCYVNKPFYCDYGCNIHVGKNFYANYDCIILDVNKVTIGDNVMLAPRVCIYTAGHPIDKDIRNELLEYGYPVTIGDDVWVGGNTVINPGVTIGSNVVIGSNSVVTKDIPSNVVAAGNPCRVIRKITDEDKKYCENEKKKRIEFMNE